MDELLAWIARGLVDEPDAVRVERVDEGDVVVLRLSVAPDDVDERALAERLYAPDMPDPDVLVRTSGELRVSNFLLWQLAYAELVFVDGFWPDFGREQLRATLDEYARRRRRFGGR